MTQFFFLFFLQSFLEFEFPEISFYLSPSRQMSLLANELSVPPSPSPDFSFLFFPFIARFFPDSSDFRIFPFVFL